MKLTARHVVARNESGDRAAIVGGRNEGQRIVQSEMIGMDEIGVQPFLSQGDAIEERMRTSRVERVPAHVRNLELGISGLDHLHIALDPAKSFRLDMFKAAFRHQLHPNTY